MLRPATGLYKTLKTTLKSTGILPQYFNPQGRRGVKFEEKDAS